MVETKVVINVGDPNTKKIAEVLQNKTATKILGYLSEETASVSRISKELDLALNTVDYNVKNLKKVGLIEEKKHFWSDRGKRMPAYTVSNKEIVISPRSSFVKGILLPAGLVSLIGTGIIYSKDLFKRRVVLDMVVESKMAESPAQLLEEGSRAIITNSAPGEPLWAWFLFGAVTAIILVYLFNFLKGGFKK